LARRRWDTHDSIAASPSSSSSACAASKRFMSGFMVAALVFFGFEEGGPFSVLANGVYRWGPRIF
jgi:hypothetical protein